MWILVSKFRWSHSHLFTVVDPLLDDRHRILMRFRNSGLFLLAVRDSQRAARYLVAVKHKPLLEWFQLPIP